MLYAQYAESLNTLKSHLYANLTSYKQWVKFPPRVRSRVIIVPHVGWSIAPPPLPVLIVDYIWMVNRAVKWPRWGYTLYHHDRVSCALHVNVATWHVVQERSNITYTCDVCVWRIRVTYACDVCVWRIRVTYACDVCVWRIRVTYACDVYVWRMRAPGCVL